MNWDARDSRFDVNDDWSDLRPLCECVARAGRSIGRFGIREHGRYRNDQLRRVRLQEHTDGRSGALEYVRSISYTNDDQQISSRRAASANIESGCSMPRTVERNGAIETDLEILITDNFLLAGQRQLQRYGNSTIPQLLDELGGAAPGSYATGSDRSTRRDIGVFGAPVTDVFDRRQPAAALRPSWQYNLILQYSIPVSDGEFYAYMPIGTIAIRRTCSCMRRSNSSPRSAGFLAVFDWATARMRGSTWHWSAATSPTRSRLTAESTSTT